MNKIAMSVGPAACLSLPGYSQQGKDNAFSTAVLFGTTSAPSCYWYDQATGSFSHDQKGIIFWPNGTYYLSGMLLAEYFFLGTGK